MVEYVWIIGIILFYTAIKSSHPLAVKTPFQDMKMSYSANQAYDMITKADRNVEPSMKQEAVYETLQ